jgi:hypothetical protein
MSSAEVPYADVGVADLAERLPDEAVGLFLGDVRRGLAEHGGPVDPLVALDG